MLVRIPIDDRIILNALVIRNTQLMLMAEFIVDHFLYIDGVARLFLGGLINVGPRPSDVIWCHRKGLVAPRAPPLHRKELDATPGGVGNRLNGDTSPGGEVIGVVQSRVGWLATRRAYLPRHCAKDCLVNQNVSFKVLTKATEADDIVHLISQVIWEWLGVRVGEAPKVRECGGQLFIGVVERSCSVRAGERQRYCSVRINSSTEGQEAWGVNLGCR